MSNIRSVLEDYRESLRRGEMEMHNNIVDALSELEELELFKSEYLRLEAELNSILHPNGDGPTAPSFCDLVAYVRADLKPKLCGTCAFDHCGCSIQDTILQVDPNATFDTFGCIKHETQLCKHKFEWADGSISTCYLPFGHSGQCNGTVYGSKCFFPKEYSSQEEATKAEWCIHHEKR